MELTIKFDIATNQCQICTKTKTCHFFPLNIAIWREVRGGLGVDFSFHLSKKSGFNTQHSHGSDTNIFK